ncbi:hypothetical protein [Marinomonas sp.]
MSVDVSHKVSQSVRRRGFACLVLLMLALFSMAMTTNSMMMTSDSMNTMSAHTMTQADHDMSIGDIACQPESMLDCATMTMDHSHQGCLDSHCSAFSGLLLGYINSSDTFFAVHTLLPTQSYTSAHPSTPYFPPIVIS